MLNTCILGWYGTETLGDRSILGGIFKILSTVSEENNIKIGSLYPFLTERTFYEDGEIYENLSQGASISCFDVKSNSELKNAIQSSDLVIMGGGPLMDLSELIYIEESFKYAKKIGKKTAAVGCGIGPLNKSIYKKKVYNIINYSDIAIFRDEEALVQLKEICLNLDKTIDDKKLFVCYDPAILPIHYFSEDVEKHKGRVVINLRKYPFSSDDNELKLIDENIVEFIKNISEENEEVLLVPNHTFFVGGDDRKYFNYLNLKINKQNVRVIAEPLNLYELFNLIKSAEICIGMRYHAILFQTLLNGNNYIFDYTDAKKGKIISFLEYIGIKEFYKDRYVNLSNISNFQGFTFNENKVIIHDNIFVKTLDFYKGKLKNLIG